MMETDSQQKMDSRLEVMMLFVLLTAASSLAQSNDDIREATVRTEQEVDLLQYNLDHDEFTEKRMSSHFIH